MGLSKALFLNGEEMMTWKIFILPELAIVQERLLILGMGVDSVALSISFLLYGLGLRSQRLKLWTVGFSAKLSKMKTTVLITLQRNLSGRHSDVLFLHWKFQKLPLKILKVDFYTSHSCVRSIHLLSCKHFESDLDFWPFCLVTMYLWTDHFFPSHFLGKMIIVLTS